MRKLPPRVPRGRKLHERQRGWRRLASGFRSLRLASMVAVVIVSEVLSISAATGT